MSKVKEYNEIVRTYLHNPLTVYVGRRYKATGFCGLADGMEVTGTLIDIDRRLGYATIFSDQLEMPCAVSFNSIYEI